MPDTKTLLVLLGYMIFSTAVSSMPPPQANSSPWYEWSYKFLNGLSANITALRGKAAFDPKPTAIEQTSFTHTDVVTKAAEPKP